MSRLVAAAAATLLVASPAARAAELQPLSAQDAARAQQILSSFDPSSYEFLYKHVDGKGKVQSARLGGAVGLASIRQQGTVKPVPGAAATGLSLGGGCQPQPPGAFNFYKSASSVNTVNVFKNARPGEASANLTLTINIFKNAGELAKAQELNALLQKYYR